MTSIEQATSKNVSLKKRSNKEKLLTNSETKFLPSRKVRCIETQIHRGTVVNVVAAYLHAGRLIKDSEDITDIEFGDLSGQNVELVPIKIYFKKAGGINTP